MRGNATYSKHMEKGNDMKFDMHCHTKEGSIDAKVELESYVKKLAGLGYDGMLVTDHNSYKGHDRWRTIRRYVQKAAGKPFVVLRGIEYDTRNGGHMLVVLPERVKTRAFEARGMSVQQLEQLVHKLGGIIGPAHPYGNGYFAFMHTRAGKKDKALMHKFDFVESFNACSKPFQNRLAKKLARRYHKPELGGSDGHRDEAIGTAFTEIDWDVRNNDDLIRAVKAGAPTVADGDWDDRARKKHTKFMEQFMIYGYWLLNKVLASGNLFRRRRAIQEIRRENKNEGTINKRKFT